MSESRNDVPGLDPWRTLEALSFYRAAVGIALLVLATSNYRPPYFDTPHAALIDATLYLYLFVAALLLILARGKLFTPAVQAGLHIVIDIGVIIALVLWSGGGGSGLGALLVTPVAAGSLLLQRPLSVAPPALATLLLLSIEVYLNLRMPTYDASYTQTGILGAGLFIIALTGGALARRARESEARAQRAQSDLAKLATLSETVIQKMQAGVLVINADGQVELLNRAARTLIGSGASPGRHLSACAPTIWQRLNHWRNDPSALTNSALELREEQSVWAQFTRLGAGQEAATLVVLDDASRVAEQAQSLKLASLGRLTASIAHEIRNPLAAIQHATELAREPGAEQVQGGNAALLDIIHRQSRRLAGIVDNVLKLSRRNDIPADNEVLSRLIDKALQEYAGSQENPLPQIDIHIDPPGIMVAIDPAQFSQILHNLLDNALHHAQVPHEKLRISIDARISQDSSQALIDIRDNGQGIPPELMRQVFEPFFSTRHGGTGLGLFITRELCTAAHGDMQLLPTGANSSGAFFRLSFPVSLAGI